MIIGVVGKAGVGKDTIARAIAPRHLVWQDGEWRDVGGVEGPRLGLRDDAVQLASADPLKVFCQEVYNFSDDQLWGPSQQRNAPDMRYPRHDGSYLTPREALQTLGTEWGRARYDKTWIHLMLRRAQSLTDGPHIVAVGQRFRVARHSLVVVSDVRFQNEVELIRSTGGVLWQVVREGVGLEGEAGKHQSETEQDGFEADVVLHNDSTISALTHRVEELLRGLRRF